MSLLTRSDERHPEKSGKKDKAGKKDKRAAGTPDGDADGPRHVGRRRGTATEPAAVNLLSPWVLDELRVRRLRKRFLLGALALAVVVAGTWSYLRLDLSRDRQGLRDDEAVGAGLSQQIGDLADVKQYVANITVRAGDVEDTMSRQLGFADVMRSIEGALPPGASVDTVEVTVPTDPQEIDPAAPPLAAACPGADPFGARPVVACLSLTGTAASRAEVSDLLQALAEVDVFVEPFVSATSTGDADVDGVRFEGTLGLDAAAYTGRFADVDGSDTDPTTGQKRKKSAR
jgi:Tfp pilus assembly protein PilN